MSFDTRLLNGLNVLAAIVEAGNFVRAGEALGLTQSGVSRAMQRFERCCDPAWTCAAGCGVAQVFELGAESMLASGILVNLFPDWTDELFPLYALHPSKNLPPAKVRAFLDFIIEAVGFEV